MAREAFDFGEVVGGEEDGGFGGALEKAFDELIANERIKAAEAQCQTELAALREQYNTDRAALAAEGGE